ncbi:MAG: hypothetical protein ACK4NC_06990 [Candidatus Gracilibacteria bacterium]
MGSEQKEKETEIDKYLILKEILSDIEECGHLERASDKISYLASCVEKHTTPGKHKVNFLKIMDIIKESIDLTKSLFIDLKNLPAASYINKDISEMAIRSLMRVKQLDDIEIFQDFIFVQQDRMREMFYDKQNSYTIEERLALKKSHDFSMNLHVFFDKQKSIAAIKELYLSS